MNAMPSGGAFLGSLPTLRAIAAPPGPDAELMALCAAHAEACRAFDAADGDEATFAAVNSERDVLQRITDLRARTGAGLRAKVEVAHRAIARLGDFDIGREERLALSTLADTLEMTARPEGDGSALRVAGSPGQARGAGPDAELIRLSALLVQITGETKHLEIIDDPENKLSDLDKRWWGTADRIIGLRAVTTAGHRAKASALRLCLERSVCVKRGQDIEAIWTVGQRHDRMAWSLARDVLTGGV